MMKYIMYLRKYSSTKKAKKRDTRTFDKEVDEQP